MAPSAQPRRARAPHDRGARRRCRGGPAGAGSSPTSARSAGSSSTTIPRSSRPRCSTRSRAGADEEQVGRAVAYAAALRIARFHVQNDHGDWDTVHHAFTAANGLHQALQRRPDDRAAAGRGARRAADQPRPLPQRARGAPAPGDRAAVSTRSRTASTCRAWSTRPATRRTASCAVAARAPSWSPRSGTRCSSEDAEFHWYQTVEAGVRQAQQWPEGSEEAALVLVARRAVPRRAHADAPRAPDGRAHRDAPAPRRGALRRRRPPTRSTRDRLAGLHHGPACRGT